MSCPTIVYKTKFLRLYKQQNAKNHFFIRPAGSYKSYCFCKKVIEFTSSIEAIKVIHMQQQIIISHVNEMKICEGLFFGCKRQ